MAKREREEPRRLFKNVNFTRIIVRALIIFLFIGITFAFSYWRDEGTLGTGIIRNSIADLYTIFQYPMLNFFYRIGFYTWTTYALGLFINAYLWSILIAIMLYILSKLFQTIDAFLLRPIGLLVIITGIILILLSQKESFNHLIIITTDNGFHYAEQDIGKKTAFLLSGFIAVVIGRVFISFSFSKRKAEQAKDISMR